MAGSPTVSVRQGALRGKRERTSSGASFCSFLGIPYARPPVGHLRFKSPQPPEPWTGMRDASKEGSPCPHLDLIMGQLVGDEDCLFLNVYTPRLPAARADAPLPVMVWVHGGGFTVGSGARALYGPENLVEQGVLLVTFNYRLGPLGFLCLGNEDAPGNAGLKDQVAALHWVKDNIAVFGGDPNNVTIFGESAGAASVHLHVLSPMSKGLFRRAVAQSGSALNPWALSRDPAGRARRLAEAAGCDAAAAADPAALSAFLRAAPAADLVNALEAARTLEERRRGNQYIFVPCVEPMVKGQQPFLPREPQELIAAAPRVPLLFGLNSHEGMLMLKGLNNPAAVAKVAGDMERLLPTDLLADKRDLQRSRQLTERLKDFYFDGGQFTEDKLEGFVHLTTDQAFARGVLRAVREHARAAGPAAPVFLYEFAFVGAYNVLGPLYGAGRVSGACHGDELGYLFRVEALPLQPPHSSEERVSRCMAKMWANFAKAGNPTPILDSDVTQIWPAFSEKDPKFIRITEELSVNTGLFKERMDFWDHMYRTATM